jgi:cytochrome c oxidase subunit 2
MTLRRMIPALLLLLPLAACSDPQSILRPRGPAAGILSQMGWVVFITFLVVTFIVLALLIWGALRRRGSLEQHEPWNAGGGQGWVLVGGFIVPMVILCGMFIFTLQRMTDFPIRQGHRPDPPNIEIIGHQWWWEVHYLTGGVSRHFVTANEIHIPVGEPEELELKTADVIHAFWVPALHGKLQLMPGQTNYIRIEADQPGTYQGECAVFCGVQHAHMRILVVAQSPADYQAWYDQQLKPGAEPDNPEAAHGRDVFEHAACAFCHTIAGTPAQGKVAPDLTHLAARQEIASDSYTNDTADLEAWVTHAQSLKPGCLMPDLTEFNGSDLRDLVAYLQELK